MKVFVVGYEPIENNYSSGGFDWFYQKEEADEKYKAEKESNAYITYKGEVEISDNVKDRDEITLLVEMFLEENDWENSFKPQREQNVQVSDTTKAD